MTEHIAESDRGRKPTVEEAEAILTLVKGGWLRLELALDDSPCAVVAESVLGDHVHGCTRTAGHVDDHRCPHCRGNWQISPRVLSPASPKGASVSESKPVSAEKDAVQPEDFGLKSPPVQYVKSWATGEHCSDCGGVGYHEDDCPTSPIRGAE